MRAVIVSLFLLAAAARAGEPLTEAQATAQFKAALKAAKKEHANSMNDRVAGALSAIDTFVASLDNGTGAAFNALFTALESFQNGLYSDMNIYQSEVAHAGADLLEALSDGGDLDGALPEVFRDGYGGALDDFRAALDAAQSKALGKVLKKLEKTQKKLTKTGSVRLSWFMQPAVARGRESSLEGTVIAATRVPLVIHTVLALGFDTGSQNGWLRAAGIGEDDAQIDVRAVNEGPLDEEPAEFFELGSPFWHVLLDADLAGLPDGNVLVVAQQGTTGTSEAAFVTIR